MSSDHFLTQMGWVGIPSTAGALLRAVVRWTGDLPCASVSSEVTPVVV